jgi:hypothetical protein
MKIWNQANSVSYCYYLYFQSGALAGVEEDYQADDKAQFFG